MKNNKKLLCALMGFVLTSFTQLSTAAGFEIATAPSRFELTAKSGQRIGQSLEIQNIGRDANEIAIRTMDWTYSEDGRITYYDELLPDSCREWVTLERGLIKIPAKGKNNFRFQVDIPADVPRTECRFMIAIEGVEPAHRTLLQSAGANLSLPVTGRIAVAVYLSINGAEPELKIGQISVKTIKGQRLPVVTVTNSGDAHGRLEGTLEAIDAVGRPLQLSPEGTPILPKQTRSLALLPLGEQNGKAPPIHYPISSKGNLDWDKGSFKLNATFK
ncbi:hypothetical protein [Thiolinea disciformis]|uniref:hypothetical protein n=1 Tax=Thiolinea disciformis TaxID=125614 RepID=UPI00036E60B8|nr:hypothetical protein [Thiolinea disciformis]